MCGPWRMSNNFIKQLARHSFLLRTSMHNIVSKHRFSIKLTPWEQLSHGCARRKDAPGNVICVYFMKQLPNNVVAGYQALAPVWYLPAQVGSERCVKNLIYTRSTTPDAPAHPPVNNTQTWSGWKLVTFLYIFTIFISHTITMYNDTCRRRDEY